MKCGEVSCVRKNPEDLYKKVQVRITTQIPVFEALSPTVGRVYDAERYDEYGCIGYVVAINGKRINVRADECKEVVG